jgi:hypothetical protein
MQAAGPVPQTAVSRATHSTIASYHGFASHNRLGRRFAPRSGRGTLRWPGNRRPRNHLMRSLHHRLASASWWARWPIKLLLFSGVVFLVLYPRPDLLLRHIRHARMLDELCDPSQPELAPVIVRFEAFLEENGAGDPDSQPSALLAAVESFVTREIPYAFDWDTWGVVDYVPSLPELLTAGREDCDGRALLATALLRHRGVEAHLTGDPRHVWVQTPLGETMRPLGPPAFVARDGRMSIRWPQLFDPGYLAVGTALFPWWREAIILLAGWALLLPSPVRSKWALVALLILIEALVVLRLAGSDPVAPSRPATWWALAHVPVAAGVLRASHARSNKKPTGWSFSGT